MRRLDDELEPHPLELYARKRNWSQARCARHFKLPLSTYKKLVRGWTGVSVERADQWEVLSGGEISSIGALRWHQRNRRTPGDELVARRVACN